MRTNAESIASAIARSTLTAVALLVISGSIARAQPTIAAGTSIIFFPKVIADGSRDTTVQLVNRGNGTAKATCFYVSSDLTQIEFDVFVFGAHSTQWTVSRGRADDPEDDCLLDGKLVGDCSGAGLDPGEIPPLPAGFRGQLVCVQTDLSGAPQTGNSFFGRATLFATAHADVSTYDAIGFAGTEFIEGSPVLILDGGENVPFGQYGACPESWVLNHPTDLRSDQARRRTCLTVATCSFDLDRQQPGTADVEITTTNELGESFTAEKTVSLWEEICPADLNPLFEGGLSGADELQTRIRSSAESAGIIVLAETRRAGSAGIPPTSSAANLQSFGLRENPDFIVMPDPFRSTARRWAP